MTRTETQKLMAFLWTAYPNTKPLTEETVTTWSQAMATTSLVDAMAAAKKHIASGVFFPTIADLVKHLADTFLSSICGPEEAWGEVTAAVSRWGRYREWPFANPLIAKAVDIMGKDSICDSEEIGVERAHFMRIYKALLDRETKDAREAPVLGKAYEPPVLPEKRKAVAGLLPGQTVATEAAAEALKSLPWLHSYEAKEGAE